MSWPMVKLGDVCKLINGDRGKNYPSKDALFSEGIPFINAGNLQNDLSIKCSGANFISEERFDLLSNGKVQMGDILFCLRGSLGKFAIVDESILRGAIASSLVIIRPKNQLDHDFLKNYLRSSSCGKEIERFENGAAQPNLSAKDLKEFEIPLPPLAEQQRIAAILDKADAIRRKRQQAIQLADNFLRAVFLDMFGDPVTNPKGWSLKKLEKLASKIGSGATPKGGKEAYLNEGISLIRSLNIHDDNFLHKNLAFLSDDQAKALSNVDVKSGDVLLNITGASVCRTAIVDETILPARVNQHVCIIRSDILMPEFLLHVLISKAYKRQLLNIANAGGATREALTKVQVGNLNIPVPPIELQEKFSVIKRKVKKIIENENELLNEPLFDSLSQKAFTGKL
ncbi:restriction endonuclease subunit S [Thalassolituus oleivorans]|uniref:restriction endonuclease subunit S n=1 Tax=Thalassolituus oleivorans TaxID=187493 RepID=UPI0023F023B2|nr:restriction endonuclease subunit S [Thalassolituus oleivorans]